jgi:hypothetical protein
MLSSVQNDPRALRGDDEVVTALQRCVAASVPSAGAKASAEAAMKGALVAQLQKHGGAAKVRPSCAGQCAGLLRDANSHKAQSGFCLTGLVGPSLQQPRLRRAADRSDSPDVETMQGEMQMRQAALQALRKDAGPVD